MRPPAVARLRRTPARQASGDWATPDVPDRDYASRVPPWPPVPCPLQGGESLQAILAQIHPIPPRHVCAASQALVIPIIPNCNFPDNPKLDPSPDPAIAASPAAGASPPSWRAPRASNDVPTARRKLLAARARHHG